MARANEYRVEYKSGVSFIADSKTLLGAKREATKFACYQYGRVAIYRGDAMDPCCVKYEYDNKWTNL